MAKPTRLKDVAADTRLSETTVSRYLNNSITLPDETRSRIDEAIARLDYRPNAKARSLSRGRSDQIGLVLPELANPFFAQLAAEIELAADRRGLGVLLCATSNRPARELDYLHHLQQHQIDGLLFVTNHFDDGSLAHAINAADGVVLLDEDVDGTDVPKIFARNEHGAWLATRHLIEAGHRNIALISGPLGLLSADERAAGFRRAIAETPNAQITAQCRGAYSRDHGRTAATRLLQLHPRPTAIFTASDELLVGLMEVLIDRGIRVPTDLSVVTFDDVGPLHLFGPPITAVRQDIKQMSERALNALLDRPTPPTQIERIDVTLIVRSSVATLLAGC